MSLSVGSFFATSLGIGNAAGVAVSFSSPITYAAESSGSIKDMVVADLNADGKLDLVTANDTAYTMSVLVGNGDGTFRTAQKFSVNGSCSNNQAQTVVAGDLNGDAKIDLAFGSWGPNCMAVFLNSTPSSSNTISFANSNVPTIYGVVGAFSGPRTLGVADMDGDGDLDLVPTAANEDAGQSKFGVLVNNGSGVFTFTHHDHAKYSGTLNRYPYGLGLGDMNGDGRIDVVASSAGGANDLGIQLWSSSNTDGGYSLTGTYLSKQVIDLGFVSRWVQLGDVDGDGRLDIAVPNVYGSKVSVYRNLTVTGSPTVTLAPVEEVPMGNSPEKIQLVDMNGDGKLDLVSANTGTNDVAVATGNGDGTFGSKTSFDLAVPAYALATGDFNGDGQVDIAAGLNWTPDVAVLLSNRVSPTPTPTPTPSASPTEAASATPTSSPSPSESVPTSSAPITKQIQYLIEPLNTPRNVSDKNRVVLAKSQVLTNAGQYALVTVRCAPIAKGLITAGDARLCTTTTSRSGKLSVRVHTRKPFILAIRISAPETEMYQAYTSTLRIRMNR